MMMSAAFSSIGWFILSPGNLFRSTVVSNVFVFLLFFVLHQYNRTFIFDMGLYSSSDAITVALQQEFPGIKFCSGVFL